jgi:hypothetical protein
VFSFDTDSTDSLWNKRIQNVSDDKYILAGKCLSTEYLPNPPVAYGNLVYLVENENRFYYYKIDEEGAGTWEILSEHFQDFYATIDELFINKGLGVSLDNFKMLQKQIFEKPLEFKSGFAVMLDTEGVTMYAPMQSCRLPSCETPGSPNNGICLLDDFNFNYKTFKDFGLRLLFYHGRVNNIYGYNYPYGSSDCFQNYFQTIGNLSFRWHGAKGMAMNKFFYWLVSRLSNDDIYEFKTLLSCTEMDDISFIKLILYENKLLILDNAIIEATKKGIESSIYKFRLV